MNAYNINPVNVPERALERLLDIAISSQECPCIAYFAIDKCRVTEQERSKRWEGVDFSDECAKCWRDYVCDKKEDEPEDAKANADKGGEGDAFRNDG